MFHISTLDQIKIAYIGGESQGWARSLMSDLSIDERMSGTVALYDLDFEAAQKNEVIGNHSGNGRWRYEAVSTLKKALSAADIVIISILLGSLDDMEVDVHLPERCGIFQSVGDTVGPGGIIRGLRAVPIFAEIARAIRDYAPESWVINYTNPMSVCTRVLYKVFPGIKAIGCCHEVFGTQKLLAEMVRERLGIEVPRRENIRVNVLGINHFTWITKASYRHIDLLPIFREFSAHYVGNQDMSWRGKAGGTASFVRHTVLRLIYLKRMAPSLLRETGIWQSFFPAHTSNSLKYGNFISHLYHLENKTELRNDKKQNG